MSEAIIGLDVGTTVAKAVLFDLSGAELRVAEQAYGLRTPQPGWAELEPEEVWQAVVAVLRAIAVQTEPDTWIRAVALATQGGTLIPCRTDGTPTYRAITWMDGRARDLVEHWQAGGEAGRIRQISGWTPQPGLPLAAIAWLNQERPEVFADTERLLSVNDFLAQRLTGRPVTNPSMAGEMLLTDVATGQWSEELCRLVGISPEKLSPILPSTAILGQLQPGACRETELPAETVVINGGQDHSCEALALGMTPTGAGLLACGTAWVINAVAESPARNMIPSCMDLNYHVMPGRWVVSQFLGGLGACVEWWLNQYGSQAGETKSEMWAAFDGALDGTSPGCGGLIYAPQTGMRQIPGFLQHGGFVGLRLDHTWADMGRAILEGAAYELRWAIESLGSTGLALDEMWMIGGAAKSPHWPQIVADASGVPVLLSEYSHGPALGATILAMVGLGVFDSAEAAKEQFRVSAHRIEPDSIHQAAYDQQYAAYQQLAHELAK